MLDFSVVLAVLDRTGLVILDGIDENAVFLNHSKLDDVTREFDPLETTISSIEFNGS